MALIRANTSSGGGGTETWYQKIINNTNSFPTWSNTPITPRKAKMSCTYDSPAKMCEFTNIDPSTGIPDSTKLWRTDDGENYTYQTSRTLSISGNSISITPSAWSGSNQGFKWEIAE